MTTQAFEPSKSTGFHPSIMKGAIAMNADDLEPTTDSANQPEPETNEQARLLEQAKAWRNLSLRQANTEEAALLTELDEEELIYAYRFYLADQRRFAKRWQETMIATVKVPEAIDWLKNLGDDELIAEYQLFQRLSEQMETFIVDGVFYEPAIYRPALQWRDAQISRIQEKSSAEKGRNLQWLEGLSGNDLVRAHKLYQSVSDGNGF
jgi:hypothetical protein